MLLQTVLNLLQALCYLIPLRMFVAVPAQSHVMGLDGSRNIKPNRMPIQPALTHPAKIMWPLHDTPLSQANLCTSVAHSIQASRAADATAGGIAVGAAQPYALHSQAGIPLAIAPCTGGKQG